MCQHFQILNGKPKKNNGPEEVIVVGLVFIILGLIEYSSNIGSAKFLESSSVVVFLSIIFITIGLILLIIGVLAWLGSRSPT